MLVSPFVRNTTSLGRHEHYNLLFISTFSDCTILSRITPRLRNEKLNNDPINVVASMSVLVNNDACMLRVRDFELSCE
jgi:hypothetical protein